MSRRINIDVGAHTRATPDVIFALLVDGATWPAWSPLEDFELEQAGDPRTSVGEIRVFRKGRMIGRDQVVELLPMRRLVYVSLSGPPVRDYRAEIELQAVERGTAIRWRASFLPRFPLTGRLLERGLRSFLDDCVRGLAGYADGVMARAELPERKVAEPADVPPTPAHRTSLAASEAGPIGDA
jgi:Polyketide cyclase / dehydrase and lipid transport